MTTASRLARGSLLALFAVSAGCTTTGIVETRIDEIRTVIEPRHGKARICAPRELAWAEAYSAVADYEAWHGDTVLADLHIEAATEMARQVYSKVEQGGVLCDEDSDFDGITDSFDKCPLDPEDFDGMEDDDGCPEEDSDADGLSDLRDRCPRDPEDFDGFEDEDGCPDPDNDNDGVPDLEDRCPNQPEDRDGFDDADGCPDPDNDNDGIPDVQDQCPNEPEDIDGDRDDDGCPDLYKNIVVSDTMISLKQKVFFANNKAIIQPQSFEMLGEIADVLVKSPQMVVRIEGHTDSKGSDRYNEKLSQKRAESVRVFLMGQGVGPQQLTAVGYGESRPIADNSTEDGRQINRRVEFHIVSR
jgi:outer membrane protein OmpA-like peptidoglycan-associated protein